MISRQLIREKENSNELFCRLAKTDAGFHKSSQSRMKLCGVQRLPENVLNNSHARSNYKTSHG